MLNHITDIDKLLEDIREQLEELDYTASTLDDLDDVLVVKDAVAEIIENVEALANAIDSQ